MLREDFTPFKLFPPDSCLLVIAIVLLDSNVSFKRYSFAFGLRMSSYRWRELFLRFFLVPSVTTSVNKTHNEIIPCSNLPTLAELVYCSQRIEGGTWLTVTLAKLPSHINSVGENFALLALNNAKISSYGDLFDKHGRWRYNLQRREINTLHALAPTV